MRKTKIECYVKVPSSTSFGSHSDEVHSSESGPFGDINMETQGRGTIWRNSDSGYDLGSGTLEGGNIWQEFVLNPATQTDDANDFSLFRKLLPAPEVLLPQPKLWREEITGCVLPPRLAGFSQP